MKKELLIKELGEKAVDFISKHIDLSSEKNIVLKTNEIFNIASIETQGINSIANLNKINDIRGINDFFASVNSRLAQNNLFIGCVETYNQRKKRLLRKYPLIIAQIYFAFDFIFKRVFPKLILTRRLYFFVTAGRNRVLSKAEALGRLVFCGFDIKEIKEIDYLTYFVCTKTNRSIPDKKPSYGFLFKMNRVGKNNKLITVYKIRTMHPYAEYLQDYIYQQHKLQDGGKFKHDFRITSWGRFLRKFWIDELPMIVNLLKLQIKPVGVRPLSKQYLSLYSEELKEKRKEAKPGLIPPFYADLPVTIEEIMQSELNYLNAYQQAPIKTDCKYFFKAFKNIVFKNARTN